MSSDHPPSPKNLCHSTNNIKTETNMTSNTQAATNVMLSAIPLDNGHVVIQQSPTGQRLVTLANSIHQQPAIYQHSNLSNILTSGSFQTATTQQINRSPPKIITTATAHSTNLASGTPLTQSSKYVLFHPNNSGPFNDFIGQSNGVGNIVIVATEQMDESASIIHTNGSIISPVTGNATNSSGNPHGDEDLTSLTWLHDKNLIKGLVPCPTKNNIRQNANGITIASNSNAKSPTSEFIEETNADEAEPRVINLKHAEFSQPTIQTQIQQQQKQPTNLNTASAGTQPHLIQYSTFNKNRNNIIGSVINSSAAVHSPGTQIISDPMNGSLLGATTTVHVGPSGTTTVVEYKSNSNFLPSTTRAPTTTSAMSTLPSNSSTTSSAITPAKINQPVCNASNITQINNISTSLASPIILQNQQQQQQPQQQLLKQQHQLQQTTQQQQYLSQSQKQQEAEHPPPQQQQQSATHHPHKKYLREQMGAVFDQSNLKNNNFTNNFNDITSNNINLNGLNSNNDNNKQFSQIPIGTTNNNLNNNNNNNNNINNNNYAGATYLQTNKINQITDSPTQEFYHINKANQQQGIYDYEADSLKDFDLSSTGSSNKQKPNYIGSPSSAGMSPSKQKHPTNVPYDPHIHTNSKPPYSFSSLIFMAIEDSPEKALPVKEIYAWIVQHFPYFKTAPTGWKNSVRHNLSLNKSFLKVEKAPNMGKGSLWRVEQMQRPNLMQALQRSPFYPCSAVDKFASQTISSPQKSPMSSPPQQTKNPCTPNFVNNSLNSDSDNEGTSPTTPTKSTLDARLFPKLSKMIKEMVNKAGVGSDLNGGDDESSSISNNGNASSNSSVDYYSPTTNGNSATQYDNNNLVRDCGADSIDDVNAATAMLALKHGSKIFTEAFVSGSPVITNSPSEDHTYSAGNGNTIHRDTVTSTDGKSLNSNGSSNFYSQNASSVSSNCASSDAAYESSSEESHNVSPEELEEKRRIEEGVDALLSLSSMCDTSGRPSPIKRPASTTVEEEHISTYMENIPHINGKGSLANNLDEGYNTQSYYHHHNVIPNNSNFIPTSFSFPTKKSKQPKGLRAKIKRKATWIR